MASTITRFKYNRKYLALHEERATKVRGRYIATKTDPLREIQNMWRNIELDYIRNLYQSIPDRLDNVIKMKGHLIKYKGDFKVRFAESGVKTSARRM